MTCATQCAKSISCVTRNTNYEIRITYHASLIFMTFPRSSGILLHPTSLPSRYGIGDLGEEAFRWIDFLASANQKLWQILPLGPTGYADSPYQCFSSFAGNPLLISLDALVADGYLSAADLADVPQFPTHSVDYGTVINWKWTL